jgi:microcystin-dependent protein
MSSINLKNDRIIFNTAEYANSTTQSSIFPSIGIILLWGGKNINQLTSNFLPCDGRLLSTTAYPLLFNIIGYTYGGSGLTFNIPNMQAKFAVGSNKRDIKELSTTTLISLVSGGTTQIINSHFPHNHAGSITIPIIAYTGQTGVEVQTNVHTRTEGFATTSGPWTSTNPVGTSNETSRDYYPPYCIITYIIKVQ